MSIILCTDEYVFVIEEQNFNGKRSLDNGSEQNMKRLCLDKDTSSETIQSMFSSFIYL